MSRMKISVKTEPNGYAMTINDKHDYFYFSVAEFVKGVIYHLALDNLCEGSKEKVNDLIRALETWPDADAAIMELGTYIQRAEQLEQTCERLTSEADATRRRNAELTGIVNKLHNELKNRKASEKTVKVKDEKKPVKLTPAKQATPISRAMYEKLTTPLTMESTGLTRRVVGILRWAGGHENKTVGDVARLRRYEVMGVRGCGTQCVAAIEKYFSVNGLFFGMDVDAVLRAYEKG